MKKRSLAMLLAMGLTISMVGCASDEANNKVPEKESVSTGKEAESSEKSQESSVGEESKSLLPYTGEEITFTFFWTDTGDDYSDETLPVVQALQEKLGNIKLEVEVLPSSDYATKLPLLLASGDIPDLMLCNANIYEYIATYGQNGIFLDFAPLMEEYMPNLSKYAKELGVFDTLKDGEGHQYALPLNVNTEDYVMTTWLANATLLEELNIEIPKTQEEFLEACRKVKSETGITPIQRRHGMEQILNSVALMYENKGDRGLAYYPEEGKWDFGPTREGSELKSFLSFVNTLWEENLVDHEMNTMSAEQVFDYLYGGEFAFTHEYVSRFAAEYEGSTVPFKEAYDFVVKAIPTPAGSGAWINVDNPADGNANWAVVSNVNTEHPELLAACIDLMFSEEVSDLKNYGIEGTSYEVGEDGQNYFMDTMKIPYNYFSGEMTLPELGTTRTPWLRAFGVADTRASMLAAWSPENFDDMMEIYSLLDAEELQPAYNYKYPTLSAEESAEISEIMAPVETYLKECIVKFAMGDMDLDKEWDTFMTKLESYGDMKRVCEILNSKEMQEFSGNWR